MRKYAYRPPCQPRDNLERGGFVEADVFVRIPYLQGSLARLSYL